MEPNIADPEQMERFIHGLAKLFISEYEDNLDESDFGYFRAHRRMNVQASEVEEHFMENWFDYTPSRKAVISLQMKTIGYCRHLFTLIFPLDDEFQRRVCKKVSELYINYSEMEDDLEEMEIDDDAEDPPTLSPLLCTIHAHPPIIDKFQQFCKEFTSLMFGQFVRGVPFHRKKTLFRAAYLDINETLGENALNLESKLSSMWDFLLPTPYQITSLIYNVYGFQYKVMRSHVIRYNETFRYIVKHRLEVRVRQYLLEHASVFDESR